MLATQAGVWQLPTPHSSLPGAGAHAPRVGTRAQQAAGPGVRSTCWTCRPRLACRCLQLPGVAGREGAGVAPLWALPRCFCVPHPCARAVQVAGKNERALLSGVYTPACTALIAAEVRRAQCWAIGGAPTALLGPWQHCQLRTAGPRAGQDALVTQGAGPPAGLRRHAGRMTVSVLRPCGWSKMRFRRLRAPAKGDPGRWCWRSGRVKQESGVVKARG